VKVLVLGCDGQLGHSLAESVPAGIESVGLDLPELDIADANTLISTCLDIRPTVIINAAAYTAVDQAESEAELAYKVNVDGPRNIALAACDAGARLIHISTDFVFDGSATSPYGPGAETNPLSVYGRTKRDGERVVLGAMPGSAVVIRTAWLYSETGNNFVKTMLRLMGEKDEISVVADQFGAPTWADSLAAIVWAFAGMPECGGIYHWTDGGQTSWHEFAVAIQEEALSLGLLDKRIEIQPIPSERYPTAAKRPPYSVLDCSSTCAALNINQAQWRDSLRMMLERMVD
jgi:dTDP-4-dehydrorhamnose reductase